MSAKTDTEKIADLEKSLEKQTAEFEKSLQTQTNDFLKAVSTQAKEFEKFKDTVSKKLGEISKAVDTLATAKTTPKKSTDSRLDRIEAAITRNTGERFED